jgi:hypothetical protein
MSQIELSFDELKQEMIEEIKKHKFMVLATSIGGKVTARTMGVIPDGVSIYVTTSPKGIKYEQMKANSSVALADGNMQIIGEAKFRGHPLDDNNKNFIEALNVSHPNLVDRLMQVNFKRPDYLVIEIIPKRISTYIHPTTHNVPETSINILNLEANKAYRVNAAEREEAEAYKI